jgi:hypothetical protein
MTPPTKKRLKYIACGMLFNLSLTFVAKLYPILQQHPCFVKKQQEKQKHNMM